MNEVLLILRLCLLLAARKIPFRHDMVIFKVKETVVRFEWNEAYIIQLLCQGITGQ